ncbi:MAG: arabinofuranosidase catalytic domain-containing protein, partial [Bacteroidota bacterium]
NETFSLIGSNTTFNITTAGSEFAVGTIPAARTLGLNGSIQELVLFASTLNLSLLQTLENNQSCYYSTLPAITYNPIVGITAGTTSVNVSYSNAQFNPITYSIAWDAAAIAAGFTNVSDAILPAGNFSVSIPNGAAAGGVYTGTLTVKNDCGTSSAAQTLTISVLNPILGTTQVAQVAYSVRKLSPGYSGPAIRVRRSSDNTQQDIGFTAGGDLDQAALLTFVGGASGFITTWYDQSGNGRNAIQNTVANQPRIVNAGVVDIQNSRPTLTLNGTSAHLTQSSLLISNPYTANLVAARAGSNPSYQRVLNLGATGDGFGFMGTLGPNYATFVGNGGGAWNDVNANSPATAVGNASNVMTMTVNTGTAGLIPYLNGNAIGTKNGTAATATGFQIGSPYNGSNFNQLWSGNISEFTIFGSSLSDPDRQTIENNQFCYFFIKPTIALSSIPGVPANTTSTNINYTATTLNPTTYSITWDAAALAAGFANVTDDALTPSSITVNMPNPTAAGGIFNGILTVKTACGVQSINYPIAIRILNPILGTTQTAQAAYSIRKVTPAYNGPAIRVRRSSDNTTQDIGFTATGDLDQTALIAFVGSGDGFVNIWYDQSGNVRDAVQNVIARQPRIVSAGVVDLANARPTLTLLGGQNMVTALTNAQAVGTGVTATISSVFRTNNGVNQSLISGNGNEYNIHAPWSDGNTYYDVSNPGQGRI